MALDVMASLDRKLGIGGGTSLTSLSPPMPPQLSSKFERLRIVGKGSFGQAVLVKHKVEGVMYIIKEVNMNSMSERERRDALNEITVLSKLNHPNIIKYYESCQHESMLYIVMEYADGGDLWQLVQSCRKKGGFSEEQVLNYLIQICMALQHMHSKRMLHRDMKTGNVFLTNQKRVVKLGDFGISTALRNTDAYANTVCGTPNYFSPEMVQGKPYNNKSDVWALGCILYEMMAGQVAFQGNTITEIYQKIVKSKLNPLPQHYSREVRGICAKLLAQNQAMRPDINAVLRAYVVKQHINQLQEKLKAQQEAGGPADQNLFAQQEVGSPAGSPSQQTPKQSPAKQQVREPEPSPHHPPGASPGWGGSPPAKPYAGGGGGGGVDAEIDAMLGKSKAEPKKGGMSLDEEIDALLGKKPAAAAPALRPGPPVKEMERVASPDWPKQPDNNSTRLTLRSDIDAMLNQLGTLRDIPDGDQGGKEDYTTFGQPSPAPKPVGVSPRKPAGGFGGVADGGGGKPGDMSKSMRDIFDEELENLLNS